MDLLAFDFVEFIDNIYKAIAQRAVEAWNIYRNHWVSGAKKELADTAEKDGRKFVLWARRLVIGAAGTGLTSITAQFHAFAWLPGAIHFLTHVAALL
jgi:hypothetical protein